MTLVRILAAVAVAGLLAYWGRGRLVFPIANALAPRAATTTFDVAYGPHPRQRLDVYVPAGAVARAVVAARANPRRIVPRSSRSGALADHEAPPETAPPPVVVFFYGGSWNSGQRGDYRFVGEALASKGFVAIVADYRVHPEVAYPDFLRDCALALAFALREAASLGGDPRRVFVMGHSAGGYNAAMLALDGRWLDEAGASPDDLAGFIGLAGPYDFLPTDLADVRPVFHHPDYPPASQPIDHVSPAAPPSFVATGRDDTVVSPTRSTLQLASRLRDAGVAVTVRVYPHVGHLTLLGAVIPPLQWMAPLLDDVATFVRTTPAREGR